MDKLAEQLRKDAEQIDVQISPQLEDRIRASLESASQEQPGTRPARPSATFWWASSLTGIAAAVVVIAIVNLSTTEPEISITEPQLVENITSPFSKLNLRDAVSTETLERELDDIQADLKKAQQALREDIEQIGVDTSAD